MAISLSITEVAGQIDARGRLSVDETLPVEGPLPVRVWVLLQPNADEFDDRAWLSTLAQNPVFADLNNPAEELYTLDDGKPFQP